MQFISQMTPCFCINKNTIIIFRPSASGKPTTPHHHCAIFATLLVALG